VHAVREDPVREGLLYAGTEAGVYVSFDDGAHWQSLTLNLPATPVTDLKLHGEDLVLSTMGRGFWILDDLSPLREVDGDVAAADVYLFQPADAYRMRYSTRRAGPADPEWRPAGVLIDYYLAKGADGRANLEIVGDGGIVIRRFTSRGGGGAAADTASAGTPSAGMTSADTTMAGAAGANRLATPGPGAGTSPLPTSPGMHRFVWELRHVGPWSADSSRTGRGGPLVAAGEYTARLTVGGRTLTRTFRVLMDPRVEAAGVTESDVLAQEALNLRIRDALSRARRAARRVEGLREELTKRIDGAPAGSEARRRAESLRNEADAIDSALVSDPDVHYPETMLIDQIEYLYGMTTSADQRPGGDAGERLETLVGRLEELEGRIDRLARDLPVAADVGAG
jgi:hypothetical protein